MHLLFYLFIYGFHYFKSVILIHCRFFISLTLSFPWFLISFTTLLSSVCSRKSLLSRRKDIPRSIKMDKTTIITITSSNLYQSMLNKNFKFARTMRMENEKENWEGKKVRILKFSVNPENLKSSLWFIMFQKS